MYQDRLHSRHTVSLVTRATRQPVTYQDSRSEPPYYPHPPLSRPSPVGSLSASVATIQNHVHSLWGQLYADRQCNIQNNLETAHSMLRMTDWLTHACGDRRVPCDHLVRQRSDLMARIEAFKALDRMQPYANCPPHGERRGISCEI